SCLSDSWYCSSFFRRSMTRGYEDLAFQAISQLLIGIIKYLFKKVTKVTPFSILFIVTISLDKPKNTPYY
ncbi:hypothetical protein, partial [Dysgonomonas sp. 521]|uniref:hypothetical protein n=1 Tax=Dysgonomonas sp. 521 TaxID=2302932 RepID=UPI001C889BC0